MVIRYADLLTRNYVKENPQAIFLYGDNLEKKGFDGFAGCMRGEPNAIGIPIKKRHSMESDAFFSDDEYKDNCEAIDKAFNLIPRDRILVLPKDGIDNDQSKLRLRAPKTYNYILYKIKELLYVEVHEELAIKLKYLNKGYE